MRRNRQRGWNNVTRVKEEVREVWSFFWLEQLVQDLSYGVRVLRKSPAFTFVAVLTLTLGICANTAIFSVVDWLILRPLPVKEPEQLTYLVVQHNDGRYDNGFSYPNLEDIRKETTSVFSYVAGVESFQMDVLSIDGNTVPIWTNYVTGDFFELLGIRPALGALFCHPRGRLRGPILCWLSATRSGGHDSAGMRTSSGRKFPSMDIR